MKRFKSVFVLLILIISFVSTLNSRVENARYDVLYFHATMRCEGCLAIEEFTKNSLSALFDKQLKDSSLTFNSIDFMEEKNAHFQDDYKFEVQTLIISKKVDGKEIKWKNLDKIWDFNSDYQKFQKYIEDEITSFIKEK
jgi:hypothetical protein